MKFSNLRLLVNDFDKCFSFYKDTLGLKCTWGAPGDAYASFDIGLPSGLSIFKAELMNNAFENEEVHTAMAAADKTVIVIEVEDVDSAFIRLSEGQVKFLNQPKDMPGWGIRVVHFRDPEENLIELYSALPKEKWGEDLIADGKKYNQE